MKITALRTHVVDTSPQRSWLFVEVMTDEGAIGLGEASQSRNDAGVVAEIQRLEPEYVGQNPLNLIERRLELLTWPYVGRTLFAAVSELEQALWDLCGKKLNVPVYQLLGGSVRERVRAYANIGYATGDNSPEAVAHAALGAAAAGFDAIKLYPFGMRASGGPDAVANRRWLDTGVERVRAVRDVLGSGIAILVDLMHQFTDLSEARRVARRLDPFDLFWIEDPFVHDDPKQLAEYRQSIGPRLAGGAPHLERYAFRPLLEHGSLDVIMPDVKWIGGISEAKKTAAMADAYGVLVSPHNASGPVATAASLHLALSLSNFLILEYAWGVPSWRADLCRFTEHIEHGYFTLPRAPGLGIDLDVALAAHQRSGPDDIGNAQGIRLPAN